MLKTIFALVMAIGAVSALPFTIYAADCETTRSICHDLADGTYDLCRALGGDYLTCSDERFVNYRNCLETNNCPYAPW